MKRALLLLALLALLAGLAFLGMRRGLIPTPEFLADGEGRREGEAPVLVEPDGLTNEEREADGELRAPPRATLRPGALATGPAPVESGGAAARSSAALRGVVLAEDGRAIANAKVTLAQAGKVVAEGTTDAEGRFKLDVSPGRYDVRISAGRDGVLMMDDVIVDGRGLEGTFKLAPAAKLRVNVTTDGRGVAGVPVVLRASEDPGARVVASETTDGRGVATFEEIVGESVIAEVSDRQGFTVRKKTLPVAGGESTLELPYPAFVAWTGVARDAETLGGVAAAFRLDIDGPDGLRYRATGESDAAGVFTLSLPKGRPTSLTVMSDHHASFPSGKEVGAALGAIAGLRNGPVTHDVALRRGAQASGTVKGPDGHGVPGLGLELRPDRGTPSVMVTDATGRYALDWLAAGTYRVSINTSGWYPKSGPAQFKVPEATASGPASIVCDIDVLSAGIVSGSVTLVDGSPAVAARVWLVGGRGVVRGARNAGRVLETFSAQDGSFSIDDVPPVEGVRVRATFGDAEALPSDVLPLAAGAPPPVHLVLAVTVKLSGRVTDLRTGAPIAGANVDVNAIGDPPSRGRGNAVTNADGRYELPNRIPGRWRLVANRKRDYLPGEPKEVELVAGTSPFTADLVLDPGLPIAGIVVNEAGDAFQGVRLVLSGMEDGAANGATVSRNANTGADGTFRWTAMRPGRYALVLSRKGWLPLSVPLRGGEDRLRLGMTPAPAKN